MRREWNFTVGEPLFHLFQPRIKNATRVDHLTLIRCPGADLRAERPGVKVFVGFIARSFFHFSFNSDLTLNFHPVQDQRGVRIFFQLLALFARVIGEENKTALIEIL